MRRRASMVLCLVGLSALGGCHPRAACDPIIDNRMPVFERFGITTKAQLRAALRRVRLDREYAWLVSWLHDLPMEARVRRAMLERDPNDLQSVIGLERALVTLGKLDQAVAVLQDAQGRKLQIREVRGSQFGRYQVDADLCLLLRRQDHLHQAEAACRRAIAAGDDTASVHARLAAVLVDEGDGPAALGEAQKAVAARDAGAWDQWILGVTLQAVHMPDKARAAFQAALKKNSEMEIAWRALNEQHTVPELMALNRRDTVEDDAYYLGLCGHYYLDLDMPKAADRCLKAADARVPGTSFGIRVIHLGETNPAAAWDEAQADLKTSKNPTLEEAAGWVGYLSGHVDRARSLLDAAVAANPVEELANLRLATVCEAQGDDACKKKALAVAIHPDAHDVTSAVVKFLLLLLPVLGAYVILRGFVLRRIRDRGAAR